MGKNRIVVGCQWGDEGKGKVVDLLAERSDIIARFQGGANAGHTIIPSDKKLILHLIPSGVTYPDKKCFIGNGVVLDLFGILEELDALKSEGIDTTGRLFISSAANLVMPYHKLIDAIEEKKRGGDGIGTTLRGIGPAYRDKISRNGIRLADLYVPDRMKQKLNYHKKLKAEYLSGSNDERADLDKIYDDFLKIAPVFRPCLANVSLELQRLSEEGKTILYEGAQGAMLDIDLGTYPFTTSSNTTVGGALTGLGIGPRMIDEIIGIVKAYTTRVGEGPFPTELVDKTGIDLREAGAEYGATTGRPRRTGWLDLVALKHACRINGVEKIAVTKLDVLSRFEKIKVCIGYKLNGETLTEVPLDLADLSSLKPIYDELDGWNTPIDGMTQYNQLPPNARKYLEYLSEKLSVGIALVSIGPKRSETIIMDL
jgi:adenylosuccinate synthase